MAKPFKGEGQASDRDAGQRKDLSKWFRGHPSIEKDLREFFDVIKSMPCDEEDLLPGSESVVWGDYKLLKEIGAGGMAKVYLAEQISLKRPVALKILPSYLSISQKAVSQLKREAEAGGRQNHPGIVTVYAVGTHKERHYIAQELIQGGYTLSDRLGELQKEKELPIGYFRKAAKLISKVAEAMEHAHRSGVIHRDVKPSNILLTQEGEPKVTDFGLAKVEDALSISRSGEFQGTPYYMSPEQVSSRKGSLDHRTDIYSLGVTLYEVLSLRRPFEGETSHEVMQKIALHEPRDPCKLNPRLPRDLGVICLKAMEKEPDLRYQTMEELASDLKRFLLGEVVLAKPAGATTRLLKRVKRNPVVSLALVSALFCLMALVLYVLWSYPQIKRERDRALVAKAWIENEAKKAQAVTNFLQEMFSASDPRTADKDVKVRDLLDKAAKRINSVFKNQPEIAAVLHNTVGRTYFGLGIYNSAKECFENALKLSIRKGSFTRDLEKYLAAVNLELGHYSKAETQFKKILAYWIQEEGELSPKAIKAKADLAVVLMDRSRHTEAEALLEESLDALQPIYGDAHPKVLNMKHNLAIVLGNQGKHAQAEGLLRQVLKVQTSAFGKGHRQTLITRSRLARTLGHGGNLSEAEDMLRTVHKGQSAIYGQAHRDTLQTRFNLAVVLTGLGKHAEAERIYCEVLKSQSQSLAEDHPDTLETRENLAMMFLELGRYPEAEVLIREALEARARVYGEKDERTLAYRTTLARLLLRTGQLSEAETLVRNVLKTAEPISEKNLLLRINAKQCLALVLKNLGRYGESELLFREMLEEGEPLWGHEHPAQLYARLNLGSVLMGQHKPKEAKNLFEEVLEVQLKNYGSEHPDTLSTQALLAQTLLNLRQASEAETVIRRVVDIRRRLMGEDHIRTIEDKDLLAMILLEQKKPAEAERIMNKVVKVLQKKMGHAHQRTMSALNRLAKCMAAQGKKQEAEALLTDALDKAGDNRLSKVEILKSLGQMKMKDKKWDQGEAFFAQVSDMAEELGLRKYIHKDLVLQMRGECLLRMKKYSDAAHHLQASLEEKNPNTKKSLDLLIELYEQWDKPKEVEKYRTLLLSLGKKDEL